MTLRCPYCQKAISLKEPKPGRFATKCPSCSRRFQVAIGDDPAAEPVVTAIRSEAETHAAPAGLETVATSSPPASRGDETVTDSRSPSGQETGAWASETGLPPSTQPATKQGGADEGFRLSQHVENPSDMPTSLGGYQVIKELGRGGMGAVYLAKQLSLDRDVALKVMRPEWASNPSFVSRFTREAYAAAQLVHHNVVQIYDFGEDRGTNYFSMEFVRGRTLADLVKEKRKLDPEVAVGYVLQAARGLKFAHDQSMIHRDVKPDNLMLNDQGVVKVADLGLVKTPSVAEAEVAGEMGAVIVAPPGRPSQVGGDSPITLVNVAMGTPAYMAPEQARNASGVDARADVYSLGCTLYDLVAGRPPFEGKTVHELITKHQTEPAVPPERFASRVSPSLSGIILKMIAKKPEDRYPNLGEVIKDLEEFLGVSSTGVFSPREEHANLLIECAREFNAAPTARLRPKLLLGAAGACALVVLLALLGQKYRLAGGFLGLGLMSGLAYFVARGLAEKSHLFLKTRELVFGSGLSDWLMGLAGLALLFTLLTVFHLFWAWLAFAIVAVVVAVGFHREIDRKVRAERLGAIEKIEPMLRSMRLQGLDEEAIRQFVCKYAGDDWEEFYETLFGYEAVRIARDRWGRGERGVPRRKHAAWRDPIVAWIEAKQQARRSARDRKLLEKIEEKGLEAQGVNLMTARRKARRAAEAMVEAAAEVKMEARKHPAERTPSKTVGEALRRAASKPDDVLADKESAVRSGPRFEGPMNLVLGARTRFLLGAALLGACLLWMNQNGIIDPDQLKETAEKFKEAAVKAAESQDMNVLRESVTSEDVVNKQALARRHEPLQLPMVPSFLARRVNGFGAGVAGLILLISAFFRGWKLALFAIPGAAIAWLGPALGVPPLTSSVSMIAGTGIGALGFWFNRGR